MRLFLCLFSVVHCFRDDFREQMLKGDNRHLGLVEYPNHLPMWSENGVRRIPTDPRPLLDTTSVSFSGIFANGTVLQREPNKAAVFGMAPPNAQVSVVLADAKSGDTRSSGTTTANTIGEWKWVFDKTYRAGGNFTVSAKCDSCPTNAWMTNVTFGDIWWCAGQSNMELALQYTISRNESWNAYVNGSYRNIRLFQSGHNNLQDEDRVWVLPADKGGEWITEITDRQKQFDPFSAVCWYFAQELTNRLGDDAPPLGLVNNAIGGTMVEAWTMNHTLDDCVMDGYIYNTSVCVENPELPCGGLFNGMVAPWLNFTIKGVLWYQGENNMHEEKGNIINQTGYACMFDKMKDEWRELWSAVPDTTDPEFGFGVVTLAQGTDEGGKNMARMRWAQTQNYGVIPNPSFKNGFMAQAYDLGDPWNGGGCWARGNNKCTGYAQTVPFSSTRTPYYMGSIHPRVKFEVGRRLAVAALNIVYGHEDIPYTGPTISWCKFTRDSHRGSVTVTLQFNQTLMNPMGIQDGAQQQLYVTQDPWPNMPNSVMQVLINDSWVGVAMNERNDGRLKAGQVTFTYSSDSDPSTKPMGLRYAWDSPGGCCVGLNTAIMPCVPRSCPIMQKHNMTYVADNLQVGLELGLPTNPFWADFVWDDDNNGHCVCKAPQKCDLS